MTAAAVVMLIVSILVVWGGLVVATIFLATHPLEDGEAEKASEEPGSHHL